MADLILISGEEEFSMESAARDEAASRLSSSVIYLHADDLSRYEEEVDVLPIGGVRRVFIVRGATAVPRLPSPSDTLIVLSKKRLEHPDSRRSYDFPKLKSFDNRNEYLGWIIKEGQRFNIDLSRVANGLFLNCRRSLRKISSEIQKLSSYTTGVVTPDDLRAVLCFSAELSPKDVLDAICDGQTSKAITLLDRLQESADETGWVLAYLLRHVLQQMRMVKLRADGVSSSEAARTLGVHPYVFKTSLEPRTDLWTMDSLGRSLDTLCSLDLLHKTGNPSARLGLEAEIVRLSEEIRCQT